MLQILWSLFEDWDVVIYILRQFCCALSAFDKFTEYLYFFGEGGSGKDTLLLLIITLMGEVNPGYAKYLKKNYFVTKDKDVSNADPFLAGLWAARWVTVSEVPERGIPRINIGRDVSPSAHAFDSIRCAELSRTRLSINFSTAPRS